MCATGADSTKVSEKFWQYIHMYTCYYLLFTRTWCVVYIWNEHRKNHSRRKRGSNPDLPASGRACYPLQAVSFSVLISVSCTLLHAITTLIFSEQFCTLPKMQGPQNIVKQEKVKVNCIILIKESIRNMSSSLLQTYLDHNIHEKSNT